MSLRITSSIPSSGQSIDVYKRQFVQITVDGIRNFTRSEKELLVL